MRREAIGQVGPLPAALAAAAIMAPVGSSAEVCFLEPVASSVDIAEPVMIDWQADPRAAGYCSIHTQVTHLCIQPDPDANCSSTFRELRSQRVVKVQEFAVKGGSVFALIGVTGSASCSITETKARYLLLDGAICVFRPVGAH